MQRTRNYLMLLAIILLSTMSFSDSTDTTIRLYTENFGRLNYSLNGRDFEHKEENIGGTSTELIIKVMNETGLRRHIKLRAWSVAYERALKKPYNGVFSTSRTEARENLFYWIGPIGTSNVKLYKKAGRQLQVNSLEEVKKLRIGGYKDSASTLLMKSKGFDIIEETFDSVNPKKLDQELIDIWVASDVSAQEAARKAGFPNIEPVLTITTTYLYLAMNKDTPADVLETIQTAYDKVVKESGFTFD